ncbi:MAG: hypothetical protein ACJAYF_003713 [Arenicella sp.]|jgi:hypothetical protein
MIKLHSFGAAFGLIDASPFVAKVKLFLAVHKIDYQEINDVDESRQSSETKISLHRRW